MDLSAVLTEIEIGWRETVKPAIERGSYSLAQEDMLNLDLALNAFLPQITKYHSGLTFVVKVKTIQDQLARRSVETKAITEFEAYLRQTKLSVSTENLMLRSSSITYNL